MFFLMALVPGLIDAVPWTSDIEIIRINVDPSSPHEHTHPT